MAKRTKKVGTAGRFQARYGVRSRTRIREVEALQKQKHKCPSCSHLSVKRTSTSIWKCTKCGTIFAGGSYLPQTPQGSDVEKIVKGLIAPPLMSSDEV
ncbi:MAG: 50S ribosomal protein L37Ae [Candidatus Thermoplasmatota archaeon]